MKTYVIVHGSIRVDKDTLKKTGETIELDEKEALKMEPLLGKPGASLVLKSQVDAEKAAAAAAEKARAEALAKAEAEEKAKADEAKKAAAEKAKADSQKGGK